MKKLLPLFLCLCSIQIAIAQNSLTNAWDSVPSILARIVAPSFPNVNFNILNYGAVADGTKLNSTAINAAITACSQAGGGKVIVPAGTFLTGAIKLKSNVNLYLSKGATLKFSINPADYLPVVLTRFEGVECYNYSPFIYAYQQENIAITGSGTLDGNADIGPWLDWKYDGDGDRTSLFAMGQAGTAVSERIFGSGYKIRPVFIQPHSCKNILIDSISIKNSPMWEINPVLCENITVSHANISSHGVNNDGCNPECCKDVWIHHCVFDTGDDCIAIKSGRNNDGRRVNVPSQNIVIQNCTMLDGHGGVVLGSEISGSVRNVFAENCTMSSPNLERALRVKTNSVRGGTIENIHLRNIQVGQVSLAYIEVNMNYEEGDVGSFTPVVRNFSIDNLSGTTSPKLFNINCYARSPISNLLLKNSILTAYTLGTYVNVRKLQIVNTSLNGQVPLLPAASSSYQHAELYASKNNWGWSNVLTGFTGTGYFEACDADNAVEYNLNKTQAEQDKLVFRYANPSVSAKVCSLYVNNVFQSTLNFAPASNWSNQTAYVDFAAGSNTLKLVADGTDSELLLDNFTASYYGPVSSSAETENSDFGLKIISTDACTQLLIHNKNKSSQARLFIYSADGLLVLAQTVNIQAGANNIPLPNKLEKGIYSLGLQLEKEMEFMKFIKQ